MKLIRDIIDLAKDYKDYNIKVLFEELDVTVYLSYDPDHQYRDEMVIPIRLDLLEQLTYIPHDEYVKTFNPDEYGIVLDDIKLIHKIMKYLDKHSVEISKLCSGLAGEER